MPVRPVSHPLALERLADARTFGGDVDPLAAAIAIATHHTPTLKPDLIRAEIDGFARDVRHFVKHENPMALAVNHVLFERNGLYGEREHYSDPKNSYINCVVERKRGLPILLCLMWVQTVLRAGGKAHGIGLPGHFIVALDLADDVDEGMVGRIYFDPFNRGMQMSEEDCYRVAMAAGVAWHAEFMLPVTGMQWAIRMLNNLRNAYHERGDAPNTAAVLEQMLLLDPENALRKKELQRVYETLDQKISRNN